MVLLGSALLPGARAEPPRPAERSVVIDRVEVTGVTLFGPEAIQKTLEVNPGDRLERAKAVKSTVSLQTLYKTHGYEQVSVRSQLLRRKDEAGDPETVLEFVVTEGLPTRIAAVEVLSDGALGPGLQKQWNEMLPSLRGKLELRTGDIFDQGRVSAAGRVIQEFLASREYVGAKVDDIQANQAGVPAGVKTSGTARWVNVYFRVQLGDRVTFGFRGNTVFNQTRLLSLVEDQRVLGFGKDYLSAIRGRIEEEYRALGYGMVHVDSYTFENKSGGERHVTYEIKEGPRMRVESVDFDGNEAFSNEDLREQFFAKAPILLQQGYYSEKDVQKAAELVIEWMKSKGYLSAKLVTINTVQVPKKRASETTRSVRLVIYVYEFDQTIVQSVTVTGSKAVSAKEIHEILGVEEGRPLNLFAFSEGIEALKALYRSKGHLGVAISNEGTDQVIRYSRENRFADIQLNLVEGARYKASRINIEGLTKTKEYVVRRELLFKEGDVLEEHLITDSEARLRRLGLFAVVTLRVTEDPDKEGHKIIRIALQEGVPGVYGGGLGYRNDLGPRVFGGVGYSNLWGENHTLSFDASANRRLDETYHFPEYQAQLVYLWPWFTLGDTTFRPALTASGRQYSGFDAFTISASATWEKRLTSRLTTTIGYSLERVRQINSIVELDNQVLTIGAVTTSARLDLRDSPLAPTRGFYGSGTFEVAAPFLLSQGESFPVGYTRFTLRTDYLFPLSRGIHWYLSFRMGFARSTEAPVVDPATGLENPRSGSIPLIKQFALGGAGSLRGFREQELNDYSIAIRGTQSYVNYRTQIDLPFSGSLRFGPFLDAANLQFDSFSLGNLRLGAGLGFHYQTPVGPVNLDYGFKLDPRPGEDAAALYFSIGVI